MDDITVKKATADDIDFISMLEEKTFSSPWDKNSLLYAVNDPDTLFFLAEYKGEKAGYISAKYIAGEMDINNVAVEENFRKRGVASALLTKLTDASEKLDCDFITLEVRASNDPAINLYKKFGFTLAGVRKNYYTLPTEDALILTKF